MKTTTRKLRSPIKWHGGKSYLCRRFIDLFPDHDVYVEPFAGGLSTLLNKPRSKVEVANDLDSDLILMWRTLQSRGDEVRDQLSQVDYSETTFQFAKEQMCAGDPLSDALNFIVRNRMSRGGMGKDFAWSDRLRGKRRPGGPVPGEINSWETFVKDDLPRVIERIQGVRFRSGRATFVIDDYAPDDGCLIYADPPYLHETRTHKNAYAFEMTAEEHRSLLFHLDDARCCGAKVFLSGYPSGLYRKYLEDSWGWHRLEFDMPNHSGQGKAKQRRTECLWESQ